MTNIRTFLDMEITTILNELGYISTEAYISQSNRPDLSDYQSNVAMVLAKKYHKSPIEIAKPIIEKLQNKDFVAKATIDGPGFINLSLSDTFMIQEVSEELKSSGKTIILDYGGPNIAKEMHVGHLRSAIIGESLKRIMRRFGDTAIGDVHFGDWGTPIGMLIAQLKREQPNLAYFQKVFDTTDFSLSISEISALYRRAAAAFKEDDSFKDEARIATFELQKGNQGYRALWKLFKDKSVEAVIVNYDKLDVEFDLWMGESDVNDLLPQLIDDLSQKGLAVLSEGALIVKLPRINGHSRAPLILKKSDGAYTYAATDLATIIQRVRDYKPTNILYVVDARQHEHFEQVFEVARMAGYVSDKTILEHIAFGTVNGKDGKPFKTRAGGVMNLNDLINLAIEKAKNNIAPEECNSNVIQQATQLAIGALKYQDVKNSRISDYIFDTENFTKSEGKTGVYIQYAVARINSILDKSGIPLVDIEEAKISISHPLERELLLHIKRNTEALFEAYVRREPSVIAEYIYILSQKFSTFYSEVPINSEDNRLIKLSRLKIVNLIRKILKENLNLLGISAPDRISAKK